MHEYEYIILLCGASYENNFWLESTARQFEKSRPKKIYLYKLRTSKHQRWNVEPKMKWKQKIWKEEEKKMEASNSICSFIRMLSECKGMKCQIHANRTKVKFGGTTLNTPAAQTNGKILAHIYTLTHNREKEEKKFNGYKCSRWHDRPKTERQKTKSECFLIMYICCLSRNSIKVLVCCNAMACVSFNLC